MSTSVQFTVWPVSTSVHIIKLIFPILDVKFCPVKVTLALAVVLSFPKDKVKFWPVTSTTDTAITLLRDNVKFWPITATSGLGSTFPNTDVKFWPIKDILAVPVTLTSSMDEVKLCPVKFTIVTGKADTEFKEVVKFWPNGTTGLNTITIFGFPKLNERGLSNTGTEIFPSAAIPTSFNIVDNCSPVKFTKPVPTVVTLFNADVNCWPIKSTLAVAVIVTLFKLKFNCWPVKFACVPIDAVTLYKLRTRLFIPPKVHCPQSPSPQAKSVGL